MSAAAAAAAYEPVPWREAIEADLQQRWQQCVQKQPERVHTPANTPHALQEQQQQQGLDTSSNSSFCQLKEVVPAAAVAVSPSSGFASGRQEIYDDSYTSESSYWEEEEAGGHSRGSAATSGPYSQQQRYACYKRQRGWYGVFTRVHIALVRRMAKAAYKWQMLPRNGRRSSLMALLDIHRLAVEEMLQRYAPKA
jgi:hypothetical protein